jgi:toxin ParE1/3/4
MMRQIQLQPVAETELNQAAAWYESRRDNLGAAFLAEIDRCFLRAARNPEQFSVHEGNIHYINANRFPYRVYFRIEPSRIVILAVFHNRRDPSTLLKPPR